MDKKRKLSLPKVHTTIYTYDSQLASAFQDDCEQFLLEYESLQTLKFQDFAKVWNLLNFSYVFSDQDYAVLLQQLVNNCFFIVKKFIVFPRSIYTQTGAFYLLYGLYYKQPIKEWIKIRLTLQDFKIVQGLVMDLAAMDEPEPLYIFAKMKLENAFVLVGDHQPLGPEDRFIKTHMKFENDTFYSLERKQTLSKFRKVFDEEIPEMQAESKEYEDLLKKYSRKNPKLTHFESTITSELGKAFSTVFSMDFEHKPEPVSLRALIRKKAMSLQTKFYRAVELVEEEPSTSKE